MWPRLIWSSGSGILAAPADVAKFRSMIAANVKGLSLFHSQRASYDSYSRRSRIPHAITQSFMPIDSVAHLKMPQQPHVVRECKIPRNYNSKPTLALSKYNVCAVPSNAMPSLCPPDCPLSLFSLAGSRYRLAGRPAMASRSGLRLLLQTHTHCALSFNYERTA